jgi:hypothetical protein
MMIWLPIAAPTIAPIGTLLLCGGNGVELGVDEVEIGGEGVVDGTLKVVVDIGSSSALVSRFRSQYTL